MPGPSHLPCGYADGLTYQFPCLVLPLGIEEPRRRVERYRCALPHEDPAVYIICGANLRWHASHAAGRRRQDYVSDEEIDRRVAIILAMMAA